MNQQIDKEEVMEIIQGMSVNDYLTTKSVILDLLNLDDTKENRNMLTKVINQLKEEKRIYTVYGLTEGERGYRGRGYFTDERRK